MVQQMTEICSRK